MEFCQSEKVGTLMWPIQWYMWCYLPPSPIFGQTHVKTTVPGGRDDTEFNVQHVAL